MATLKTLTLKTLWILLLLGLLAGCEIRLVGEPRPDDYYNDTLRVYDARYTTNYRDRRGQNYICDNLETPLTYEFYYDGALDSWKLYLEGSRGGVVESRRLTPRSGSVEVSERGYVRDRYAIPRYAAPLSVKAETELETTLKTQDIVVVFEPDTIGESKLYLEVEDESGRVQTFETQWLSVADNCP